MYRLKKLLVLLLVFVMGTGMLAGCGGQQKASTPAQSGQNADESKKEETKKEEPKQEQVTLVYTYGGTDPGGNTKEIMKRFMEKYPNIKVELQALPNSTDDQHNAYVTALSSKDDSFDVFSGDIIWPPEFASAGWIMDLDNRFPQSEREKFLQGPIKGCTVNGKIYAVPWFTDSGVLYYRTDIIQTPPKTWDELIQMAKANKDKAKYGFVFQGNQYEGLVCDALEYIWNNGGEILNGENVVINSPEAIEGLQIFVNIVKSGIAPEGVTTYQEEDARNVFQEGNAIFMRNWPYAYTLGNKDDSKIKGKIGVAPLPVGPKGTKGGGTLGGWNIMINANTKHPEEAWKLAEFMTSYEMQVVNNVMGGSLPTRKDVYNNEEVKKVNPWVPQFLPAFEASKPRPVSPFYTAMSDSMQINFHKAITGEITAQKAIENVEKDMKDIIAKGK